jgi:Zn-dependent protease
MPEVKATPTLAGSFRVAQVAGISVYVHWSWLVVGYLELQFRTNYYGSQVWNVLEYFSLFVIVLMHEFGHTLACRQVGGRADQIVLWPLGGIAFVQPPARPGALLWSIAAGPLVNVILVPVTLGAVFLAESQGLPASNPDAYRFLGIVSFLNIGLLIFNMVPIYPLDGGQILQALLWFVIGRSNSLLVVSIIGMIAAAAIIVVVGATALGFAGGVDQGKVWFGIIAVFIAIRSWAGFRQARLLAKLENAPRHRDAACPSCQAHPLKGDFWQCDQCGARFDTFTHHGICPSCSERYFRTACPECRQAHHIDDWFENEA